MLRREWFPGRWGGAIREKEIGREGAREAVEDVSGRIWRIVRRSLCGGFEAVGLDQECRLAKLLMEKARVVGVGLGENLDERVAAGGLLGRIAGAERAGDEDFEKGAEEAWRNL